MTKKITLWLGNPWVQRALIMIVLIIIMAIFQPLFFSFNNMKSILIQIAIYCIVACGMLIVILVGALDLSVGSMMALSSVLATDYVMKHGTSVPSFIVAISLSFGAAIVVGFIHGVFDAVFQLPSFVVTLASKYVLYGIAMEYTKGAYLHIAALEGPYYALGNAKFLKLPLPIVIMLIMCVVTTIVLEKTTYGRRLYAVGGNKVASRLIGINPRVVKISAYIICSMCAALGGMVLSSQNLVANYIIGSGYDGTVMMVMVVGGVNLMGGEGNIGGVLFGGILVGMLNNMIILLGINTDYAEFVQGIVILFAVAMNIYTSRKSMGLVRKRVRRADRLKHENS